MVYFMISIKWIFIGLSVWLALSLSILLLTNWLPKDSWHINAALFSLFPLPLLVYYFAKSGYRGEVKSREADSETQSVAAAVQKESLKQERPPISRVQAIGNENPPSRIALRPRKADLEKSSAEVNLPSIVIDGSNVMYWGANENPSLSSVRTVVKHVQRLGFSTHIFFDANIGYKLVFRV